MTDPTNIMNIDELAQEIRRVDGSHTLGAGALAEAILPFIARKLRKRVKDSDAILDAIGTVDWAEKPASGQARWKEGAPHMDPISDWFGPDLFAAARTLRKAKEPTHG